MVKIKSRIIVFNLVWKWFNSFIFQKLNLISFIFLKLNNDVIVDKELKNMLSQIRSKRIGPLNIKYKTCFKFVFFILIFFFFTKYKPSHFYYNYTFSLKEFLVLCNKTYLLRKFINLFLREYFIKPFIILLEGCLQKWFFLNVLIFFELFLKIIFGWKLEVNTYNWSIFKNR